MKRNTTKAVIATVLAAAFAGISITAIAQNATVPAERQAQHMAQRGQGPMAMDPAQRAERQQQMQQRHAQRHAARLDQLKAELKLTPAQEPAWLAFAARTEPTPRQGAAAKAQDLSQMTTPQRLEALQAQHAERGAELAQRIEATKSFYAQLSPEQQKSFDAQSRGFQRAGMKGEHRKGGQGGHSRHGMSGGMGCEGGSMPGGMGGAGPRS